MKSCLQYAGKKLMRMVLLLLGVSLAAFLLMSASPLDPLQSNIGQAALGAMSTEQIAKLETYWGVNTPPLERYLGWLDSEATLALIGQFLSFNQSEDFFLVFHRIGGSQFRLVVLQVAPFIFEIDVREQGAEQTQGLQIVFHRDQSFRFG